MSYMLPPTWPLNRYSPTMAELEFINKWCIENLPDKPLRILEFGCGPSTHALYNGSLHTPEEYVSVENYQPAIDLVRQHIPEVKILDLWEDISFERPYDLVFIDSSAGNPWNREQGMFRKQSVELVERNKGAALGVYIMHDWHGASGRGPRSYFEKNGFRLLAHLKNRTGVGIYQRSL